MEVHDSEWTVMTAQERYARLVAVVEAARAYRLAVQSYDGIVRAEVLLFAALDALEKE